MLIKKTYFLFIFFAVKVEDFSQHFYLPHLFNLVYVGCIRYFFPNMISSDIPILHFELVVLIEFLSS